MRDEVGAGVAVDVDVVVDVDVDVDCSPVFSGRLLSANELKAMAILEAVHSRARLQEQCYRLCDGKLVEADTFCKLGHYEGWLEEYCLGFALNAGLGIVISEMETSILRTDSMTQQ